MERWREGGREMVSEMEREREGCVPDGFQLVLFPLYHMSQCPVCERERQRKRDR